MFLGICTNEFKNYVHIKTCSLTLATKMSFNSLMVKQQWYIDKVEYY